MTALDNDAALRSLNLLHFANIQALQQSPEKLAALEDMVQNVMANGQPYGGMPDLTGSSDSTSKAVSSSSGSVSPREGSEETETSEAPQPAPNPRQYRQEPWHECFTTTKELEFEALIYSVYVAKRDDKKLDGCEYYECHNRLQSKCRYKVRTKKVNEFFIVEEKGAHNHAMEPVGSPGSHAGLPKTLREIVDTSFHCEWPNNLRQQKIEEEVKRLGLPHNPRLGRQVDNRIAYLRRVKNLSETRKNLDQANGLMPQQMSRSDHSLPNGGNPEELLKLMLQTISGGMPLEEGMSQLTPDSMTGSQMAISPQMIHPPVSQPQIIVHENNNEILKVLAMQQNKDLPSAEQSNQAILNMLMSNSFIPPAPTQQEIPMDTQDSSSSSNSPEDRLQIED